MKKILFTFILGIFCFVWSLSEKEDSSVVSEAPFAKTELSVAIEQTQDIPESIPEEFKAKWQDFTDDEKEILTNYYKPTTHKIQVSDDEAHPIEQENGADPDYEYTRQVIVQEIMDYINDDEPIYLDEDSESLVQAVLEE